MNGSSWIMTVKSLLLWFYFLFLESSNSSILLFNFFCTWLFLVSFIFLGIFAPYLAMSCLALILASFPQPCISAIWCDKQNICWQNWHFWPNVLILALHFAKPQREVSLTKLSIIESKSTSISDLTEVSLFFFFFLVELFKVCDDEFCFMGVLMLRQRPRWSW